jgi:hypothetical protein
LAEKERATAALATRAMERSSKSGGVLACSNAEREQGTKCTQKKEENCCRKERRGSVDRACNASRSVKNRGGGNSREQLIAAAHPSNPHLSFAA